MNSYERRRRILKLKRELRQEEKRLALMEHQDQVILKYEIAFKDAYGYYPVVHYHHGWYCIRGGRGVRRMREQDLLFEAKRLWAIKHAEELGGTDE